VSWPPRTIRARLALWHGVSVAVVILAYAAVVVWIFRSNLIGQLDHQIHDHLDFAQHMLTRGPDGRITSLETVDPSQPTAWWLTVFATDGTPLYTRPAPNVPEPPLRSAHAFTVVGDMPVKVEVTKSAAPIRQRVWRLVVVMCLGLPIAAGAAGIGGHVLVGRALAPLRAMAARARRITAERLSDRLPTDGAGDELAQLAAVFNETFARLERSFEQLRNFTADASHELRTPLTALRTVGEVALCEPRDAAYYREIVGSMLEEVDRLQQLVESLLLLSRADAGQLPMHRELLDLGDLTRDLVDDIGVLADERGQRIELDVQGPVPFHGDRLVVRQALLNVLDNAIKHSPRGGTVRVGVAGDAESVSVSVTDGGPGIAPADQPKIFDRFYRADRSRARSPGAPGGAGLGLAIARWSVESHGGRIVVRSELGRGSTFRVVLPRAVVPST
jgi:heavy metal sensor kinase